jgi:hypothetical protein
VKFFRRSKGNKDQGLADGYINTDIRRKSSQAALPVLPPLPIAEALADALTPHEISIHALIGHMAVTDGLKSRQACPIAQIMIALPMPAPFIGAFLVPVIRHGDQ